MHLSLENKIVKLLFTFLKRQNIFPYKKERFQVWTTSNTAISGDNLFYYAC